MVTRQKRYRMRGFKICEACGCKFRPWRGTQKYCSVDCSCKAKYETIHINSCIDCNQLFETYNAQKLRCDTCQKTYEANIRRNTRNKRIAERKCVICGDPLPDGYELMRCEPCRRFDSIKRKDRRERKRLCGSAI